MKKLVCDFCRKETAVGVYSSHLPISMAYCQKCLDVNEIRTWHNVNRNWYTAGDKYLENNYTVFFNDRYMNIKEYIDNLTEDDIMKQYPNENSIWKEWRNMFIDKIKNKK